MRKYKTPTPNMITPTKTRLLSPPCRESIADEHRSDQSHEKRPEVDMLNRIPKPRLDRRRTTPRMTSAIPANALLLHYRPFPLSGRQRSMRAQAHFTAPHIRALEPRCESPRPMAASAASQTASARVGWACIAPAMSSSVSCFETASASSANEVGGMRTNISVRQ